MPRIQERLYLPLNNDINELKRQLQFAWGPMVQQLNSICKLYYQDTQPVIPENTIALWVDTDGGPAYYLVANFGGTHKKWGMT